MKRILLVVALMFSSGVFASCEISNTGLPDNVVQKLKSDCENLRLAEVSKKTAEKESGVGSMLPTITPERVTGWAQVAEGFANAVGAAAHQLGVSVNDFIKTPAGMITIGVILWKVIGVSILKLIAMYGIFLTGRAILQVLWKVGTTPVERKFAWWSWTYNKPVYSTWSNADEGMCMMGFLILAVCGAAETVLLVSLVL